MSNENVYLPGKIRDRIQDLMKSHKVTQAELATRIGCSESIILAHTKIAELDHWTDKQETKATIDNLIRDTLWAELPESYDEVSISVYRQKIYEYVYTRYKNVA